MQEDIDNTVDQLELSELSDAAAAGHGLLAQRFDLLEHVQVSLEVVVGEGSLTVQQLFALTQGAVVPLNTLVDEPVTLRVHGKTIACGELVAVGEQFGVRITEIAAHI